MCKLLLRCQDCSVVCALSLWSVVRIHPLLGFHLEWGEPLALCNSRRRNPEVWSHREEWPGHCSTSKKASHCPKYLPLTFGWNNIQIQGLSIFYRCFHGHCSHEIREVIPVPLRRIRTTRSSTHSHPFQVSLPNPRTLSHKSSLIPRTCNLWNVLPSSRFPESYKLPSFKSNINKLDLISLSS